MAPSNISDLWTPSELNCSRRPWLEKSDESELQVNFLPSQPGSVFHSSWSICDLLFFALLSLHIKHFITVRQTIYFKLTLAFSALEFLLARFFLSLKQRRCVVFPQFFTKAKLKSSLQQVIMRPSLNSDGVLSLRPYDFFIYPWPHYISNWVK